ncbi:hypothetical protein G647_08994 [Cladophialophora carrionii CBS 160.54]|uniref:Uncharacterized protein n=1 Tax=Cladophialophora carrionii CBS 160.54 TaxID=1279043 RepID=V9CZA4_9EURO|nr:uncharacterized protein G647_08994 [Cladophialophora carrionii CBS 160.54]ETI19979.1 hypothetical protein G647_08994 [Cladophialophora carrionii CBS 160.54]
MLSTSTHIQSPSTSQQIPCPMSLPTAIPAPAPTSNRLNLVRHLTSLASS